MRWLGVYCASKFAVVGLTESLFVELRDQGIGVSVLCPMVVATNINENSLRMRPAELRNPAGTDIPQTGGDAPPLVGGTIQPEELARRVVRAIERRELYILTHPEQREILKRRAARQDAAFNVWELPRPSRRGARRGERLVALTHARLRRVRHRDVDPARECGGAARDVRLRDERPRVDRRPLPRIAHALENRGRQKVGVELDDQEARVVLRQELRQPALAARPVRRGFERDARVVPANAPIRVEAVADLEVDPVVRRVAPHEIDGGLGDLGRLELGVDDDAALRPLQGFLESLRAVIETAQVAVLELRGRAAGERARAARDPVERRLWNRNTTPSFDRRRSVSTMSAPCCRASSKRATVFELGTP